MEAVSQWHCTWAGKKGLLKRLLECAKGIAIQDVARAKAESYSIALLFATNR